jgi:phosphoadenosine phosphosulfate reductase
MPLASTQTNLENKSFIEVAISQIQEHEPPDGYWLAFSGGKDSVVIYDLAERAGVKFDPHFAKTSVDTPEVLDFIREHYPNVVWEKPKKTMFQLIRDKKTLPTRFKRFCCGEMKEIGGIGRTVIVGVRAEESINRSKYHPFEKSTKRKKTWFLRPILYWSTTDVWDYIKSQSLPYCHLYDQGYDRIGCIMCPCQGARGMALDAERFPKFYQAYMRAIHYLRAQGRYNDFPSDQAVMDWWMKKIPSP